MSTTEDDLSKYLAKMDHAGGGIYTTDFRDGFRHALAMLAACESGETVEGEVHPAVREAARTALARRAEATHPMTRPWREEIAETIRAAYWRDVS